MGYVSGDRFNSINQGGANQVGCKSRGVQIKGGANQPVTFDKDARSKEALCAFANFVKYLPELILTFADSSRY
jgi:hypothetical protein